MPTSASRSALLAELRAHDILGTFHYMPLHRSAMGRRHGRSDGRLPVTDVVSARLVRLPFYTSMSQREQQRVLRVVLDFRDW